MLPPVGFSATADGFTVKLSWGAPSASAKVVGYEITRNGRPLTSAAVSATSVSDDVRPGKTYRYEIRSKGVGATSDWVSDEVNVKTPPLKEARVEGDFGVTARVLSKGGFKQFEAPTFAWHMAPKCRSGACDVVWRAISFETSFDRVHALLQQRGKQYAGTFHGYFGGSSHGTRSITTVDLTVDVAKAKPVDGEWRASKLEGILAQSDAAQFGCVPSQATVSVKASLATPSGTAS